MSSRPTRGASHHAVGQGSSALTPRQVSGCGSKRHDHRFQIPCRTVRARIARGEPARAAGLGDVDLAVNAGRAPSHAIRRGFRSPTPRQVGSCGFEATWSQLSNPVPCAPRALCPLKNWPTAHQTRLRLRTWRGCLHGHRGAHSTPHRWPRLFCTDTAPGQRLRLRNNVTTASESSVTRSACASPMENRPTATEHARAGGLGEVDLAVSAGRAPSHANRRGSCSPTPRQVGGCSFEATWRPQLSNPCRVARACFAP